MMSKKIATVVLAGLSLMPLSGCDSLASSDVQVEKVPSPTPSLPTVPTIPPPPHPVKYEDGSYSVYGIRAKKRATINTEAQVSAYIVKIYEAPECDKPKCTALIPHLWVADKAEESDKTKLMLVVGYAESQKEIDEAIKDAKRNRKQEAVEGMTPIPTDFAVGNKINLKGRFTHVAGAGFTHSDGLMEYRGHETVEGADS